MARFAHHNVEQYSPLLGLSFQIRFHVKYSCEKSILVKTYEILDESREFAFSCSSQWMMGIAIWPRYMTRFLIGWFLRLRKLSRFPPIKCAVLFAEAITSKSVPPFRSSPSAYFADCLYCLLDPGICFFAQRLVNILCCFLHSFDKEALDFSLDNCCAAVKRISVQLIYFKTRNIDFLFSWVLADRKFPKEKC